MCAQGSVPPTVSAITGVLGRVPAGEGDDLHPSSRPLSVLVSRLCARGSGCSPCTWRDAGAHCPAVSKREPQWGGGLLVRQSLRTGTGHWVGDMATAKVSELGEEETGWGAGGLGVRSFSLCRVLVPFGCLRGGGESPARCWDGARAVFGGVP